MLAVNQEGTMNESDTYRIYETSMQSAGEEELSALTPSILDRAFKGEL